MTGSGQITRVIAIDWLLDLPPAPGGPLRATMAVSPTGFVLQRSLDSGPWVTIASLGGAATAYTDTTTIDFTRYAYRIQAVYGATTSEYFQVVGGVRSTAALPAAPTLDGVTALAADTLKVAWTAPAGSVVSSYRIERRTGGGVFAPVGDATGETLDFVDTDLLPATAYDYRVVAINATGESPPSNVASGTTRSQTLPAPRNLQVSVGPGQRIRLTWEGAPAGASAVVEVTQDGLIDYLPLATTAGPGPFAYVADDPGAYGYRVKFVLGNDESPYTTSLRAANFEDPPPPPSFPVYAPFTSLNAP
jgi:titin